VNGSAPAGFSPIVKLCVAGAAPPATTLNASALGDAVNVFVVPPVSTSVTGIEYGELFTVCPALFAPVSVMITCPVCVPAASPEVFTHAVIVSCVVPVVGVTVSHATSVLIATGNGPAGVVSDAVTLWHAGDEPTAPENDSEVGVTTKTYGLVDAAVTVSVTGTDSGEFVAPDAVRITCPL
jgi:hypothetical protein